MKSPEMNTERELPDDRCSSADREQGKSWEEIDQEGLDEIARQLIQSQREVLEHYESLKETPIRKTIKSELRDFLERFGEEDRE